MSSGCYICQPENPEAAEEGCDACDAAFWANPIATLVNPQENGDS